MEANTYRAYIPDTKQSLSGKNMYESNNLPSNSRDKHNKQRAANHRLNKKKIESIKLYEKKPIFAFTLLEESISITDQKTKRLMNNLIKKYENKIRSITSCYTDEELKTVCNTLDEIGLDINKLINKRNFIKLAEKGFFRTKSDKNILRDEEYKTFINDLSINKKQVVKTTPIIFKDSLINRNISFADKLKQNL